MNESLDFTLHSPKIKNTILDVIQITHLKLIAIGSLDGNITIWNFFKRELMFTINLAQGGLHTLVFFENYSVLITAGYSSFISLFTIDPHYFDYNLVG